MSFLLNLDSSNLQAGQNKTDDFIVQFTNELFLPGNWEVALIKSNTWYSWYNISSSKNNNTLRYFNGTLYRPNIIIPNGQYTIEQLNDELHIIMKLNGDYTLFGSTEVYDINFIPNYATGKVRIEITNNYRLDLQLSDLNILLGFDKIEVLSTQEGTKLANINDFINSLFIRTDILDPSVSYNNSFGSDILYTFIPDSIPGTNINVEPNLPIYLPIRTLSNYKVKSIRLYLTDNINRRVDLNGEPFSVLLHFKQKLD
jgi:hypothetical protein